ncbi:signal peptidase I [Nocardioides xinjiangensis]|uniref:signal peptidase I n=1 Tax=Nocardioides xinjiangensis TaxID=2817376 RepID=UPI001B30D9BE|nr:signal peptidase I [Nocardioides sp. SYSU D00778]
MTTWAVLLAAGAAMALAVVVPRLAGAVPYTVLTSSMEPTMPPGTLVVVRPTEPEDIGVGSVITYQLDSGEPTVVTHRVVSQGVDAEGEPVFQTRGDANAVPDRRWVRPVQVRGEEWYAVPWLGFAGQLLTAEARQAGTRLVAAALLVYAAVLLGSGLRARRPARDDVRAQHV